MSGAAKNRAGLMRAQKAKIILLKNILRLRFDRHHAGPAAACKNIVRLFY